MYPIPKKVSEFISDIKSKYPEFDIQTEKGGDISKNWWIDIQYGDIRVSIDWRPLGGFGIHYLGNGYGQGPDTVILTPKKASEKVCEIINKI